jgi:signal transduction histidine kinase
MTKDQSILDMLQQIASSQESLKDSISLQLIQIKSDIDTLKSDIGRVKDQKDQKVTKISNAQRSTPIRELRAKSHEYFPTDQCKQVLIAFKQKVEEFYLKKTSISSTSSYEPRNDNPPYKKVKKDNSAQVGM